MAKPKPTSSQAPRDSAKSANPKSSGKQTARKPMGNKRGRPKGSIKLTPDKRLLLLTAIESGGSDHTAARAAGIDPRTFRTYREIVEGRHPTRRPDRYLIELFKEIEEARARARIRREIELAQKDPKHWLRYQAPSLPGLPGWTTPVPDEPEASGSPGPYCPTPEELSAIIRALVDSGAVENPFTDPPTPSAEEEDPPPLKVVS